MKVADMQDKNIIEPLAVKDQVLKSATEAAAMLLRIDDDVLSASRSTNESRYLLKNPAKPNAETDITKNTYGHDCIGWS
jgi:chaperonin GroEL (HSP60 family)